MRCLRKLFQHRFSLVCLSLLFLTGCSVFLAGCAPRSSAPSSSTPPQEASAAQPSRSPASTPAKTDAGPSNGPGGVSPSPTPAPPPPSAPSHAHRGAASAPAEDEYALGDQLEAWKNNLKSGAIEYRVPPEMTAQLPSTVTVNIHGYQDTQTNALAGATGSGTLKVSSRMKVELFAPVNPGEFTIAQQGGDAIQFIPNDGYATWMWNVTPVNAAQGQQLEIRVSLVYPNGGGAIDTILADKTYPITVNVQKLTVTIEQSFWKDPIAWFKYALPGGAGWGAVAALVGSLGGFLAWWKKRKGQSKPDKPEDKAAP